MSRPPTWLDRWNFISFFLSNPCNFPWIVYFETALLPTGRLILRYLSYGLLDVIRGFFRPKGLRSGRHGRKRRRGRREAIPELAEVVAKRIPGQDIVASRSVTDGVRVMWRIDAFVQRIAYYLMVVDIISEWWTAWQSAIIRDRRSDCGDLGRALREDFNHVASSGGWGQLLFHDLLYTHGPINLGIGGCQTTTGKYMVMIACKARAWIPDPLGVTGQIAIRNGDDLSQFLALSSRHVLMPGDEQDMVATFYVEGPSNLNFSEFTMNASPFNGGIEYYQMSAFMMQMGT